MSVTSSGHRQTRTSRRARGFTLIELLVVVAVLVLVSTALPVALDRALPSRRVATTSQKLAAAVRDAQPESMLRGRAVTLELNEVDVPRSTSVTLLDADGRSVRSLIAYPDGSTSGASFKISERSHARIVNVSSITGRVTLEAGADAR